jgi:hypothetical protein
VSEYRPVLRPMPWDQLIREVFVVYWRNLGALLGITATLFVPMVVAVAPLMGLSLGQFNDAFMRVILTQPSSGPPDFSKLPWGMIGVYVVVCLGAGLIGGALNAVIYGASAVAVGDAYIGRRPSVSGAFQGILPNLAKLLVTGLLMSVVVLLATIVGLPFCIVGGYVLAILFSIWLLFTGPVVAIEGRWGIDALRRSKQLVDGSWWPIFGIYLLFSVIISMPATLISVPMQMVTMVPNPAASHTTMYIVQFVLMYFVMMFFIPLLSVCMALLYLRQRIHKEGLTAAILARDLDGGYQPFVPAVQVAVAAMPAPPPAKAEVVGPPLAMPPAPAPPEQWPTAPPEAPATEPEPPSE